jgi:mannobiose 2-epimerase
MKKTVISGVRKHFDFWENNTVDTKNGGFIGKMNHQGQIDPNVIKGGVLNARILWTFSEAYHFTHEPRYLTLAQRAFDYLKAHFWDTQHGGVYWAVDALGNPFEYSKANLWTGFCDVCFCKFL